MNLKENFNKAKDLVADKFAQQVSEKKKSKV